MMTQAGHLLPFALLLTSAILAVTGIELKDWSCGFTPDQKRFTYELLSGNCSRYKSEVNLCCALHKDCYRTIEDVKDTKAIQKCNVKLCLCLEEPSGNKDGCGYKVYENCHNARMYAEYNIHKTDLDKSYEQVVPQGMDHGVAHNLYQQCEHAAYTTRACAVNHNSCSLGAHYCQKDFKDCMECIRIVQEDHDCSAALDSLPAGKRPYSPPKHESPSEQKNEKDEMSKISLEDFTGIKNISDIAFALPGFGGKSTLVFIIAVIVGSCLICMLLCSAINAFFKRLFEVISARSKSGKEGEVPTLRQLFVFGGDKPTKQLEEAIATANELSNYKTQI